MPTPPRTDHQNAARYEQVAHHLRIDGSRLADLFASLSPNHDRYDTFAVPLLNDLRPHLEAIVQVFADMADGDNRAQQLADVYRGLVEGRYRDAS